MRPTPSKQARYAETIDRSRFIKLSSKRQHEYLAHLALKALKNEDYNGFFRRYHEMKSWAELDKYTPPHWLSEREAVFEYFLFHNGFSRYPVDYNSPELPENSKSDISWEPVFDVTVVMDQVRSPYNAGSVLRLIDNFGLKGMVHNSSWLSLDHPQLRRAARGCEKWIPVEFKHDLAEWLDTAEIPVIGLERAEDSISIDKWHPVRSCILIIGNEEYGIAGGLRDRCDILVSIPMFGYKQSMNLGNALAVIAAGIAASKNDIAAD